MNELAGKVAIVTGASKAFGAGIAKGLAEAGASVVVNYASSREGAAENAGLWKWAWLLSIEEIARRGCHTAAPLYHFIDLLDVAWLPALTDRCCSRAVEPQNREIAFAWHRP